MKKPGSHNIFGDRKILLSSAVAGSLLLFAILSFHHVEEMPPGKSADGFPEGGIGFTSNREIPREKLKSAGNSQTPSIPQLFPMEMDGGLKGGYHMAPAEREVDPTSSVADKRIFDGGEPARGTNSPETASYGRQEGETGEMTSSSNPHLQRELETLSSRLEADGAFTANIVEDGQQGFILNDISPDSIFRRLHLEDGDVVITVNKEDISNIPNRESAYMAFAAFITMGEGRIEIIRNGFRMMMNFHK
jgi:hypothetical protein